MVFCIRRDLIVCGRFDWPTSVSGPAHPVPREQDLSVVATEEPRPQLPNSMGNSTSASMGTSWRTVLGGDEAQIERREVRAS